MSRYKNPYLALAFSLIPGLSHLYIKRPKKAIGLLIIDAVIGLTFLFSDSYLMRLLMVNIYLITFFPACLEVYQLIRYGKSKISTDAKWYVVVLLLTTGFGALGLLWQSKRFSKTAKTAWSVAVPLLAILFFSSLIKYWDMLERLLRSWLG